MFKGKLVIQSPFALLAGKEGVTLFLPPRGHFIFAVVSSALGELKHQADGSSVYLCSRLEHILILFAHRANISLGMKPRQWSGIGQDQQPRTGAPGPQGQAGSGPPRLISSFASFRPYRPTLID